MSKIRFSKQVMHAPEALDELHRAAECLREYAGQGTARERLREAADAIEAAVHHLREGEK